jgi:hypothetical protein
MNLSLTSIKRHIVAELLIIRYSRERKVMLPDAAQTFWIYYSLELKSSQHEIEPLINEDPEMSAFYAEWEEYDTYLKPEETSLSVITLAMKLVMAKALKYADDITLGNMLAAINDKLKPHQYL